MSAEPESREKQQFRALTRLFAYRFFDTDLISIRGDVSSLLGQTAALLMAFSFVVALLIAPNYVHPRVQMTPAQIRTAAWSDQEFLISTTMTVIGVFTLILWDALFPDLRDCLILGVRPVRTRTLFAAKLCALATALGLAIGAVNSATGIAYPFLIASGGFFDLVRLFAAYWLAVILAGAFVFLLLLNVQGIALQALSHAAFLRWSSIIQCGAFFAIVTLYFLMPPLATPRAFAAPENRLWYVLLPNYWFLGLFQTLDGSENPAFRVLAVRALTAVAASAGFAAAIYMLAWSRQMRRIVEQSGIVSTRAKRGGSFTSAAARLLSRTPLERGIFAFIGQTLARSRPHRLLLAIYLGLGLSWVCSQIAHVLWSSHGFNEDWTRQKIVLGIPLVLMFFVVIGLRVSFTIPVEVRANWIFRLADPFTSGAYLATARKTLLALGVAPVLVISAIAYGAIWPWPRALAHCAFLALFGMLLIDLSLTRFRNAPFTCAWLPGQGNLKLMFGVYLLLVIFLSDAVPGIEAVALSSPQNYAMLITGTALAWAYVLWRSRRVRRNVTELAWEQTPEPALSTLRLLPRD